MIWFLIVFGFHLISDGVSLFLRVETGHQNIAIDGRDIYYGHFTKIYFHNLTCIQAIDIHCLKELTGAEEIDLLYSECQRGHWKVAHYTNSKQHFRLKKPIHAEKLLISSRHDLSVIDAQVESCENSKEARQQVEECNRNSRGHVHRHGKVGAILRAIDENSSLRMRRRMKREIDDGMRVISGERNITEDVVVEKGTTLTIMPGTKLSFAKNTGIVVQGQLHINGSAASQVILKSQIPSENWKGVLFKDASQGSIISNANISGSDVAIWVIGGGSPYIEHVIIDSNVVGVKMENLETNSITHISKLTSVNNEKNGLEYLGKGAVSIDNTVVASNGGLGMFINTQSKIVIRKSTAYSNNNTGIYVGTKDATIEDVVVNSNGDYGLHAEIEEHFELYNVNASAHFANTAVEIFIHRNARIAISNSHFHDNRHGVIHFSGKFEKPEVILHNSNFTRNTGRTLAFANIRETNLTIEKCGFFGNNYGNYDKKDAVINLEGIEGSKVVINDCRFVRNSMHDIISIQDIALSGSPISITSCIFQQNLANSMIFSDSQTINISQNEFSNPKATCEMTFLLPKIPKNEEFDLNIFGPITEPICTGDYHRYQMDESFQTSTGPPSTINYLENPFRCETQRIAASQTPYLIREDVEIKAGTTVILDPGTVLDFAPGVGITIHGNGRLILNGTDDQPIVIRGKDGNTWRGLVAKPNGVLDMMNTVIEDASIGLWIDSEKVRINGGRIVKPVVHGIEITDNSNEVVDLGGLIIEGASEAAIGVDERRDDLLISNAEIRDGLGTGIDFVTPTGNIEFRNVYIDNMGTYSIHISEFPSSPLHAVLMNNISITNQKKGHAGVLISGGWIQNIGLQNATFEGNNVPSLIIALECNDDNEKLIRIENSSFIENRDIVHHVQLSKCANLQMEHNKYVNNNKDGIGSTLVITSENEIEKKHGIIQIGNNQFLNNSGIYAVALDSRIHDTFFTDNVLDGNLNSGAVLKIDGPNTKLVTNNFNNKDSKFQLTYSDDTPLELTWNEWNGLENAIDAKAVIFDNSSTTIGLEQLDPTIFPVTVSHQMNEKCAHLKYCSNRGTCNDGICVCPSGYAGFDCSIALICNCSNNGLCDIFNKCLCNIGWSGPSCSIPTCSNNCNNHGKCISPNQCECNPGWIGSACTTSSCIDSNCLHGHCSNGICKCEEGWQGSRCHVPVCNNCTLNGICTQPGNCKCFEDYGGTGCSECVGESCDICDFDCDHGSCEPLTRTCTCVQGWTGGACDICVGSCKNQSRIQYIQPSTAELENTNIVVSVYGTDFSKTPNNSYICTFGSTTVNGRRVSSSLIRCPVPANMTIGRHVFGVSVPGSFVTIGSSDNHPIHFTLFDGCEPSLCQGSCIGPLCICPQGKTGVYCDVIEIVPTIDRRFLEHQKANKAFEGSPYVLMLPTMTSSVLRVNSTIPNLNFIASRGIISWPDPTGSDEPYPISVTAFSPAGESTIMWNVTVEPEYEAEVEEVSVEDGIAKIKGKVNGKTNSKENPVIIRIKRGQVIDEIRAESDKNGQIFYDYVPQFPGNYEVTMTHPGVGKQTTTKTFTIPAMNLNIEGESTLSFLKLKVEGGETCASKLLEPKTINEQMEIGENMMLKFDENWPNEVIALVKCENKTEVIRAPPSKRITVTSEPQSLAIYRDAGNSKFYEIRIKTDGIVLKGPLRINPSTDALSIMSSEPNIENYEAYNNGNQDLIVYFGVQNANANNGSIEITESDQFHFSVPYTFYPHQSEFFDFKICARDEWDGQELPGFVSTEVATIALINLQKSIDITRSNIRLNLQWAEFHVSPGIYNLQIRSESHEPLNKIIELNPLNTTFCIPIESSKSKTLSSVRCQHDKCDVASSEISRTDGHLPYLKFEPSVVTQKGQKVLAKPRGTLYGIFGLWNTNINGYDVVHSKRSVATNESFWTTIDWNTDEGVDENCGARVIEIPFVYLPDGTDIPVHTFSNLLIRRGDDNNNNICNGKLDPIITATSNSIMCNCGDGARTRCRQKYRPATACGHSWDKIADDTVSLEVLASFLSLLFECKEVSVDFQEIRDSLECVADIEKDCPISKRAKRQSYQNDSPFNIVNHLTSVNFDLGKVLPVLNALDVQTIRISSVFIEFIDRLHKIFPASIFEELDRDTIDVFLSSIDDQSEDGQIVSTKEAVEMNGKGKELIELWNDTVNSWRSGKIPKEPRGIGYQDAKMLVASADRVKSISRQNIAQDPFSMLHGYMERTLETGETEQKECATSTVFIDQTEIEEGSQILVRIFIQNQFNASLTNVGVTMSFIKSLPTTPQVDFNVGPSWSAGIGSLNGLGILEKDQSFEIHWTRFVSSSRRLTTVAKYQPIIIFSFTSNGRQTQQKLLANEVSVLPKKTIKVINIIKDELSPEESVDFSIISSVINPGYSDLKNVRIIIDGLNTSSKLENVYVDGKNSGNMLTQHFDEITSGSTKLIRIVMNDGGKTTSLTSANITCIENGRILPLESSETYAIRAAGPSDYGMLLSPVHQSKPLFYFKPSAAQMVNVIKLEFLSMEQVNSSSGTSFVAAFRNPESSSFGGALWAVMPVPNVGLNVELVRINDQRPPRPRELQAVQWESEENGNAMLNWIDSGGYVQPKVLTYQLEFDDPRNQANSPSFDQSQYRIQIPPNGANTDTEIGQVSANGEDLTYFLYSPDGTNHFSVEPETGKIYYTPDESLADKEFCVVLEARDLNGRVSRVPVAINNGGERQECSIFSTNGLSPAIHLPVFIPTPGIFTTRTIRFTTTTPMTTEFSTQPTTEEESTITMVTSPDSTLSTIWTTAEGTTSMGVEGTTNIEETTLEATTTEMSATEGTSEEPTTEGTIGTTTETVITDETTMVTLPTETTEYVTTTQEETTTVYDETASSTEPNEVTTINLGTTEGFTTIPIEFETSTVYETEPSTYTTSPNEVETSTIFEVEASTEPSETSTGSSTTEGTSEATILTTEGTEYSTEMYTTVEPEITTEMEPEVTTSEFVTIYTISPDDNEPIETTWLPEITSTETGVTEEQETTISTPEPTRILPTDSSTEYTELPSTTTEMMYTMTSDASLEQITSTMHSVSPDTSPTEQLTTPTEETSTQWQTPPIVIPTQGGGQVTHSPIQLSTKSYEENAMDACKLQETNPVYKIVCDISNFAKPTASN